MITAPILCHRLTVGKRHSNKDGPGEANKNGALVELVEITVCCMALSGGGHSDLFNKSY